MDVSRQTQLIFPTPVHIVDFPDTTFCDRAVGYIKDIRNFGEGGGDDICWCTPDNLDLRPEFQEVKEIILSEIERVFNYIGLVRDSQYMTCMWANVSKPKNRHALHPHANSYYSGVLYLETPGTPGNIGFKDPRPSSEMLSPDYIENSMFKLRTIEIEPRKGRLVMFPSWLHHGTRPGNFDESLDRIALSFNIMPRCTITDHTRRLTL
jgi:uncharacterized protein (TIGR02466 family)